MKKIVPLLICIALVAASSACGYRQGAEESEPTAVTSQDSIYEMTSEETPEEAPEETTAPIPIPETQDWISEEEAVQIASNYWNIRPGDKDPDTGFQYALIPVVNQTENPDVHVIMLKWLVEGTHYSTVDECWVHKQTGEVLVPPYIRSTYVTQFELVMANQCAFYVADTGETVYIRDWHPPYLGTPLANIWGHYAYVDMDGDGIDECVLDCGIDMLVLRGYEGRIYLYEYPFAHMTRLFEDGSFAFTLSSNGVYGRARLTFDGLRDEIREIYRIEHDDMPNAVYTLEGKQVTRPEMEAFIAKEQLVSVKWISAAEFWQDGK